MKLYHISEDPGITCFRPRIPKSNPDAAPAVWAINEKRAPHYYFPRDCPRVCYWVSPDTTEEDRDKFFGHTSATWIIAIEKDWFARVREAQLYRYELPPETFRCIDMNAGYYISQSTVTPTTVEPLGDLLARLMATRIELRITPSLWPLVEAVPASTVGFSMIRLRNAGGR
ncbi:DUF6886 family protein [Laceyella putida]|uniref:DUF6886 family protein n=1 Tax=Laceyella putida TaxID=110101 RepID=A0ABW2RHN7_9BACL